MSAELDCSYNSLLGMTSLGDVAGTVPFASLDNLAQIASLPSCSLPRTGHIAGLEVDFLFLETHCRDWLLGLPSHPYR
jgi:hypothetical protein